MEKLLKDLPSLINVRNIDELSQIIKNPDSFTIRLMAMKNTSSIAEAFDRYVPNREVSEFASTLDMEDDFSAFVEKLKESGNDQLAEVATFYQDKLAKIEGISVEDKSLFAFVWAGVIYKYLTDKTNHLGITNIDDVFESLPVCVVREMSEISDDANVPVADVKKEVLSIFENTGVYEDVKGYFATAFIKNKVWSNANTWCDFKTLEPIKVQSSPVVIDSKESLLSALATPTPEVYQKAIDYVALTYFGNEQSKFNVERRDLVNYKAHLVVALLSSNLMEEGKEEEYTNIALNLCAKIIACKEKIEAAIDRSSIAIQLTKAYEATILQITEEAEETAFGILKEAVVGDEPIVDETLDEEVLPEVKKALFKVGDRKAYINGYLKLFGNLIDVKLAYFEDQLKTLNGIANRRAYSADCEKLVEEIASGANATLKTKEEEPVNLTRLHANAQIAFNAVKAEHGKFSTIGRVFAKVKAKKKDSLDVTDLDFDYKVLQRTAFIVEDKHKEVIKEFYGVVKSDPALLKNFGQYRLLSNPMKISMMRDRASAYPTINDMLALIADPSTIAVQRVVDELYINDDTSVNEKYEELYRAIMDKKATITEKKFALTQALKHGEITQEQQEVIEAHIEEVEAKLAKRKASKGDDKQITLFDYIDNQDDDENENQ